MPVSPVEIFLLVLQIGLGLVLLYFVFQFAVRSISAFTDVPYVPTEFAFLPKIAEALAIGPDDVVYDLGCGDGRLLFYCAKRNRSARFIGIEQNPLLVLYARVWKSLVRANNVEIRRGNFFDKKISDATRIFVFLLPEVMRDVALMLKASRVVSRAYAIPHRHPLQEFKLDDAPDGPGNTSTVYVYE